MSELPPLSMQLLGIGIHPKLQISSTNIPPHDVFKKDPLFHLRKMSPEAKPFEVPPPERHVTLY